MQICALLASLLAVAAVAVPTAPAEDSQKEAVAVLEARAAVTCGAVRYSAAAVTAASQSACSKYRAGQAPGGYPHVYNNREGLRFAYGGPYLEFPILKSGTIYAGGAPGPDRVVITKTGCLEAGAMTHTGARGNSFVQCR